MFIKRDLQPHIEKKLFQGKAIILYGARQTGKTTLVREICSDKNGIYLNCDEIDIRQKLGRKTSTELKELVHGYNLVVIDEAQRVEDIGITIKLFTDNFKNIQVIATGSSAFELSDKTRESLAGRAFEFQLFPLSIRELSSVYSRIELSRLLENQLIYGMYPEIVLSKNRDILHSICDSMLYKDILSYQRIRNHEALLRLIQAIALQTGNEVSYNELSSLSGIDKKTVESYLDILEKSFVIFRLCPFSRNLRSELKKLRKIYFHDTGIRNALINSFNPLCLRNDTGSLFENFIISERRKFNLNCQKRKNIYFWRTASQQEIDYLEEENGVLKGFEIKFGKTHFKKPSEFLKAYETGSVELVNKENYLNYLLESTETMGSGDPKAII